MHRSRVTTRASQLMGRIAVGALSTSGAMLALAFAVDGEIAGAFCLGASHLFLAASVVLFSYAIFARASEKARDEDGD